MIDLSREPRNESLKPFTNTAMKTTRARPIISADAVTEVRDGLRTVFSRASRPVCLDGRSGGHSSSGRLNSGNRITHRTNTGPAAKTRTMPAISRRTIAMIRSQRGNREMAFPRGRTPGIQRMP